MTKNLFVNLTLLVLVFGCASKLPEKPKVKTGPQILVSLKLQGQQSNPRFSPSGDKVIYVSWDRPANRNQQIYEYDLVTQHDQRITFQDGLNVSPNYWNESKILYSSNTDELKENAFLETAELKSEWLDIYSSDLVGEKIERLTQKPGLDDQAQKDPWSENFFFFISHQPQPGLYRFSSSEKNRRLLVSGNIEFYQIQKDKRSIVGLEKTESGSILFEYSLLKKKRQNLAPAAATIIGIAETPWIGVFLIADVSKDQKTNLFFWNPVLQCISPWKIIPGRATHLDHSPKDPGLYLMSFIEESREQLYFLSGLPTSGPCPTSP